MMTFADRLESLGFMDYAKPEAVESVRQGFRDHGWAGTYGDTGRLFPADAESLCEGGLGRFVKYLSPFLEGQGVRLPSVIDHCEEDGYWVSLNGRRREIWTAADDRCPWVMSTVRTFEIVNELLEAAGSRERMHAVNSGNDLFGFFLTPELHAAIAAHPDYKVPDGPYVPTAKAAHRGTPYL